MSEKQYKRPGVLRGSIAETRPATFIQGGAMSENGERRRKFVATISTLGYNSRNIVAMCERMEEDAALGFHPDPTYEKHRYLCKLLFAEADQLKSRIEEAGVKIEWEEFEHLPNDVAASKGEQ